MRQVGGQITVYSKQDPNQEPIRKITHKIVTQSNKNGDVNFKRYAWTIPSLPNMVLIQFTGDETLSSPLIHGNSKHNKPRVNLLPSVAKQVRNSTETLAIIYENLRMTAGSTVLEQNLFSPISKQQVKSLKKNDRNVRGENDSISKLIRKSQ